MLRPLFRHLGRLAHPRVRALLVLMALVAMQVSYASHQFEHIADDVSTVCPVCVQLDRLDDAVTHTPLVVVLREGFTYPTIAGHADATSQFVVPYRSRAPPPV